MLTNPEQNLHTYRAYARAIPKLLKKYHCNQRVAAASFSPQKGTDIAFTQSFFEFCT
jgi:hypothetical protein